MATFTREQIRSAILDTLCTIAPEIDPAGIVPGAPLREQIDLDSMDFLNVIIRLHETLGIDIPESDYAQLATLDSAVDYLARRSGAG
jgi:acyl carrier protein